MRRIMQRIARKTIDEKVNIEIMENELDSMDWELNSLVWDIRLNKGPFQGPSQSYRLCR